MNGASNSNQASSRTLVEVGQDHHYLFARKPALLLNSPTLQHCNVRGDVGTKGSVPWNVWYVCVFSFPIPWIATAFSLECDVPTFQGFWWFLMVCEHFCRFGSVMHLAKCVQQGEFKQPASSCRVFSIPDKSDRIPEPVPTKMMAQPPKSRWSSSRRGENRVDLQSTITSTVSKGYDIQIYSDIQWIELLMCVKHLCEAEVRSPS